MPRPGGFESATVVTQPTFAFCNPVPVPRDFVLGPRTERRAYDVAPDGRFLGLAVPGATGVSAGASLTIHIVLNWFEELKQRVPR